MKSIKKCASVNYFEHFLILVSAFSECVSNSTFPSLAGVPVRITSSMLLSKTKLNTIKVQISKVLINSYINHDEFVSVYNMLSEYNKLKEGNKNPETSVEYIIKTLLI